MPLYLIFDRSPGCSISTSIVDRAFTTRADAALHWWAEELAVLDEQGMGEEELWIQRQRAEAVFRDLTQGHEHEYGDGREVYVIEVPEAKI